MTLLRNLLLTAAIALVLLFVSLALTPFIVAMRNARPHP